MAGELASLSRVLNRLGVESDTDDAADALLLLRAVSEEVKGQTTRAFEGVATVYDLIIDVDQQADFLLPHVPVSDLLSIAPVAWDGTEEAIAIPEPVSHDGVSGWSTALSTATAIGDTNVKVDDVTGILAGDHMFLATDEVVRITTVGTAGAGGTGLDVEPAAKFVNAIAAAAKEVSGSTSWRLIDADRGKVELLGARRFVRVVWRTTGVIPAGVAGLVVEWVSSRWNERNREAGQTAYDTGSDSEEWDASLAGQPPPDVARVLAHYWRSARNGVI